jgi:transposase
VGHLTGDKAYSSRANRAGKGARGGRPPAFDRERYRTRNQVERLMNRR